MSYHVTVTDWSALRGYRNSGRGWRVRCFFMPENDWNALSCTIEERFHRNEKAAREHAAELAAHYKTAVS